MGRCYDRQQIKPGRVRSRKASVTRSVRPYAVRNCLLVYASGPGWLAPTMVKRTISRLRPRSNPWEAARQLKLALSHKSWIWRVWRRCGSTMRLASNCNQLDTAKFESLPLVVIAESLAQEEKEKSGRHRPDVQHNTFASMCVLLPGLAEEFRSSTRPHRPSVLYRSC